MIEYREIQPRPPLDRFVRCFWCLVHEPGAEPGPETILPDGHPELIFELGHPYRSPAEPAASGPESFVVGQITSAIAVVPTGRVELLGVRFRPAGLAPLFGDALATLTDDQVALDAWAPRRLVELEERLRDESSWRARIELVETALATERAFERRAPSPIEAAVARTLETHGRATIDDLTRTAGVSARTLDRRFRDEVGLTPKLFQRQVRFRHVFDLIERGAHVAWADVAQTAGCYDQSHLVREFQAFAGQPPAAFLRDAHELSDHLTGLVR